MKLRLLALCAAAFVASPLLAADLPAMPQPTREHQWLQKFVGEWDVETEVFIPGQPSFKMKGSETSRALGGFWILGENKGELMGQPFTGLMSLGFDPAKQKYIGSWVDSASPALWEYLGTLDAAGQILTLETKGFCPIENKVCDFRHRVEFKTPDQRVLTAERLGRDGKWVPSMTTTATRRK